MALRSLPGCRSGCTDQFLLAPLTAGHAQELLHTSHFVCGAKQLVVRGAAVAEQELAVGDPAAGRALSPARGADDLGGRVALGLVVAQQAHDGVDRLNLAPAQLWRRPACAAVSHSCLLSSRSGLGASSSVVSSLLIIVPLRDREQCVSPAA